VGARLSILAGNAGLLLVAVKVGADLCGNGDRAAVGGAVLIV
jgi:hypothetical protein